MPLVSLRCRRALMALAAGLTVSAAASPAARADFFSDHDNQLLSVSGGGSPELGDAATSSVALSSDGRYVLLTSVARNFIDSPPPGESWGGPELLRKDRATGALDVVALPGRSRDSDGVQTSCSGSNSTGGISGDGRFVAFSTPQRLVAADANNDVDVYLRDMSKPVGAPDAYRLVSARDGGDVPATYDFATPDGECGGSGSVLPPVNGAEGRASVSDDGNRVLFLARGAYNDLPARPSPDGAEGNLFVRDVAAKTTTLVTQTTWGEPVSGVDPNARAVLSGDGSTVAWVGTGAEQQLDSTEYDPSVEFGADAALMWRKLSDGVTRRVAPPVDYHDPACTPAELQALDANGGIDNPDAPQGACLTPFFRTNGTAEYPTFSLSTDGGTVAFARSGLVRGVQKRQDLSDAWVSNMAAGVTRKQGSREITRAPSTNDPANVAVDAVALAGDASRLLFLSSRVDFSSLTSPAAVGAFLSPNDFGGANLYSVDLRANTLELATRQGYDGDVLRGRGAAGLAPALSADGGVAAWTSNATNVFRGDSNDSTDALAVVPRPGSGGSGTAAGDDGPQPQFGGVPMYLGLPTPAGAGAPRASVSVAARASRRGAVTLAVRVSGRGSVSVRGTGKLGRKRVVFGSASRRTSRRGTVKLTVRATRAGRRLLGKRVTFAITFTQSGIRRAATRSATVTVRR